MLYLITNRKLIKKGSLAEVVEGAVSGGVDAVIIREKDLTSDELLVLAFEIKKRIKDTGVKLIINSNLEVAEKVEAQGFHCSFKTFIEERPSFKGVIGVSVHSLEEAITAEVYGASYLLAGHVFKTDCKKGLEPRGLKFIENIKASVKIPVLALGGITRENVKSVLNSKVDGIAVMSSIMASENPYAEVLGLKLK